MSYVTTKDMLLRAQKEKYAVAAFNTENMESIQAVISTAETLRAPVIIQITPSMIKYADTKLYVAMVKTLAENVQIEVALHLDHGNSYELVEKSISAGFSSIMIDGSKLPFEENIELTKKTVQSCIKNSIAVEAELGTVGGKEDEHEVFDPQYTDPEEAAYFIEQTGIRSLAVAIGTAHGFYKGTPVLDIKRLIAIKNKVEIPLVLHGASGVTDKDIAECIAHGICKVNFATELRAAYTHGVKKAFSENPNLYDPKEFGYQAKNFVAEAVRRKIIVCGCNGKAC